MHKRIIFIFSIIIALLSGCSVSKKIEKGPARVFNQSAPIKTANAGLAIFEPATGKYWYRQQADKFFLPASCTKLFTCYAALKYLGDSLTGIKYVIRDSSLYLIPSGDPGFLHPDFPRQPVYDFLKSRKEKIYIGYPNWQAARYGRGWAWDDYSEAYMPERSPFPLYGNVLRFRFNDDTLKTIPRFRFDLQTLTGMINLEDPFVRHKRQFPEKFSVKRFEQGNAYKIIPSNSRFNGISIPFLTDIDLIRTLLMDTLKTTDINEGWLNLGGGTERNLQRIASQPTDSLLKIMMHRSDNFYAEQVLLMAANERIGRMNDCDFIDTLLSTSLKDLPQRPSWVDGSGLSRYNLFTPESFITLLGKMKQEFGIERLKGILATGNSGTLSGLYVQDSGYIFAKTGTLSGQVALSGYLLTRKNRLLLFSILINNHRSSATDVRKEVEKLLQGIRKEY